MAMIKSKFRLFQKAQELVSRNAIKLCEAPFRITPKGFNSIGVTVGSGEFIASMLDAQMFIVSNIHQAIIATLAVGMDDTRHRHVSSDHLLQSAFRGIGDHFSIDIPCSLKDAKDYRFLSSASAAHPWDATGPKYDSSTSMVPEREATCSHHWTIF